MKRLEALRGRVKNLGSKHRKGFAGIPLSKRELTLGSTALALGTLALYLAACNRAQDEPKHEATEQSMTSTEHAMPAAEPSKDDLFTCSLNGSEWKATTDHSNTSISPILNAELRNIDGQQALFLTGWRVQHHEVSSVSMFIKGFHGAGEYSLNDAKPGRATFSKESEGVQGKGISIFYPTDAAHTGTLVVTAFDSTTHRVSGGFSFTPKPGADQTSISNGTFNLTYSVER